MHVAICVLIMILVTYLPRAIPIVFVKKEVKNVFIQSFLYYVPYAVLASLTFPSIFYICDNIYISIVGTLSALVIAFFSKKLYLVALGSVIVMLVLLLIF